MLATVVVKVALTVDADSGASIFLSLQALRPADGAAGVHADGLPVLSAGEHQASKTAAVYLVCAVVRLHERRRLSCFCRSADKSWLKVSVDLL